MPVSLANRGYRDFQDFLDSLSSRKRKQMRKEREQVAGRASIFGGTRAMNWTRRNGTRVPLLRQHLCRTAPCAHLTRAFFSLFAERMPEALRWDRQGGRDVAMALSPGGDSLFGRYWGCLDEFDRLHFETCFYQGMDFAIAEGLQRFDAGAQGEHKLIRGFEPVLTRSWHYLPHPGLRRAVGIFCAGAGRVKGYAEEARGMLPYRRD